MRYSGAKRRTRTWTEERLDLDLGSNLDLDLDHRALAVYPLSPE